MIKVIYYYTINGEKSDKIKLDKELKGGYELEQLRTQLSEESGKDIVFVYESK